LWDTTQKSDRNGNAVYRTSMYEVLYREASACQNQLLKIEARRIVNGELSIASSYIQLSGSCKNVLYELYIVPTPIQASFSCV